MSDYYYRRKPRPLFAHQGRPDAFLRRYRRDLQLALTQGGQALDELQVLLPASIRRPENLFEAWRHLAEIGGDAPGPDGVRLQDLSVSDRWSALRTASEVLGDGSYCPAKPYQVRVPKPAGGQRVIEVYNAIDRVASRGAAQILEAWLERDFHQHSFGFRSGLGTHHALATALQAAEREERYWWLAADLKNAFGSVPVNRLLDLVGQRFGHDVQRLVGRLIGDRRRGLAQGLPLSPVLLNLYADKTIDWPWAKQFHHIPLLRYADDLLALCQRRDEAHTAERALTDLMRPAGLKIKDDDTKALVDVRATPVAWLGYRIIRDAAGWRIDIREAAWQDLDDKLRLAQEAPNSVQRCFAILQGWLGCQGPCYRHADRKRVLGRVAAVACKCGFAEPPARRRMDGWWRCGWLAWCRIERALREREHASRSLERESA